MMENKQEGWSSRFKEEKGEKTGRLEKELEDEEDSHDFGYIKNLQTATHLLVLKNLFD